MIVSDTHDLWGLGGSTSWVWKSFTRGLNPIFMDLYQDRIVADERTVSRSNGSWCGGQWNTLPGSRNGST